MTTRQGYQLAVIALFLLPSFLIGWKLANGYLTTEKFIPKTTFKVNMNCTMDSTESGREVFLKMYLPASNRHQKISEAAVTSDNLTFKPKELKETGRRGYWRGTFDEKKKVSYQFKYEGKAIQFNIDSSLPFPLINNMYHTTYLKAEEHIQTDHPWIKGVAKRLIKGKYDQLSVVQALYDFVYQIPAFKTNELTDALTTLRQFKASCNGKSRLLTALCRSVGIPARVVGGLILESTEKRTSHLWVEVLMGQEWVTFDALNGHFAFLPSNYMQLYYGDHFLITHTPAIAFDYQFTIQKEQYFQPDQASAYTLWSLQSNDKLPYSLLRVILLLPICALVVGIFRNVIGIKTIGVFLPAIIAVSLDAVNPVFGLLAFVLVVGIVGLLHFPLEKWGILHTPKLIIMLVAVVVCLLTLSYIGNKFGNTQLGAMVFFPIIVLTIAAEKFAKTILEEGFNKALTLQFQTLLLTIICYPIFQSEFAIGYFLTFPETYIILIGCLLLLGRWIGLRISEYNRFGKLV